MLCCRKKLSPSKALVWIRWFHVMTVACYTWPGVYTARERRYACCISPKYSMRSRQRRRTRVHLGTEHFPEHATRVLVDASLQRALQLLIDNFVPRRVVAMAALGNAEELRILVCAIKEQVISRLDEYLERFAANLQQRGAQVHWVADAAEARQIIATIA